MASFLRVRNLEKYQHYRDRNPPWVKLHRDMLENYEFGNLPDASKGQALMILLLAARMENTIPYDVPWITKKINATAKVDIAILLESGFLEVCDASGKQCASDTLAECEQTALIEREREREGEGEKRERSLPLPAALSVPEFALAWQDWIAYRKESKFSPWKPVTVKAKLAELEPLGPVAAAAAIRRSIANGWKGIFPENGNGSSKPAPPPQPIPRSHLPYIAGSSDGY